MSFDFNVNNYKLDDLLQIFKLPSHGYQIMDVDVQEDWLRQQISKDSRMMVENKQSFQLFISEAKDRILSNTKKSGFVSTFPSQIYRGDMNPLKRRTLTKILNIDTRFRPEKTRESHFRVDLPMPFSNVVSMGLKSFEFPSAYYNISADLSNNSFVINSDANVVVANGFYTVASLIVYLNRVTSQTFSEDNGKMRISGDTTFSLQFGDGTNTLGWMMGFRQPLYEDETVYVSECAIDLVSLKYCYLCVNDFNNN
ncbi:MAG: hypothetical protein EBR91_11575, partial [Flavobacteriia bacterium]|nr:hypothetical protein [Flavobacteriia bacterium]